MTHQDPLTELDLGELWRRLASRRRRILLVTAVGFGVGLTLRAVLPSRFRSEALLLAERGRAIPLPAALGSFAAQLGLSLDSDERPPPGLYRSLVRSRVLLEGVLLAPCEAPRDRTVAECLRIRAPTRDRTLDKGVRRLRRLVDVDIDARLSVVTVGVTTRDPQLSALVLGEVLTQMKALTDRLRRARASDKRRFLEERVASADSGVRAAEHRLQVFLETNRQWEASPSLRTQQGRLQREVDLVQHLLLGLRQEYERMRLAEFDRTAALTVVDGPSVPVRSEWPAPVLFMLMGGLGLLVLDSLVFFWRTRQVL